MSRRYDYVIYHPWLRASNTPSNRWNQQARLTSSISTTSTTRELAAVSVYSFAEFTSHIDAFTAALQLDEHDHLGMASPGAYPGTPIPQSPRIRKVSALSDFAPINLKVKRYSFHPCLPIPALISVKEAEGRKVSGAQARLVVPPPKVAAPGMHRCQLSLMKSYSYLSRSVTVVHFRHHCCAVQSLHIHQTSR